MANTGNIEISQSILRRIKDRVDRTSFDSESEYVEFVLEEVLTQVEDKEDGSESGIKESEVKDRLESLGYLEG